MSEQLVACSGCLLGVLAGRAAVLVALLGAWLVVVSIRKSAIALNRLNAGSVRRNVTSAN